MLRDLHPLVASALTTLGEIREDERRRLSHTGRRALEQAELELRTLLLRIEDHRAREPRGNA